jgi:hypothetical protein
MYLWLKFTTMKRILLFIFLLPFSTMFAQSDFEVLEATKQSWGGGRMCTGFGTHYRITFIPTFSSKKMSIDSLWVADRYYPVTQFIKGNFVIEEFEANDTLTFQVAFRDYWSGCVPENYRADYNVAIPPMKYDGEALIEYTLKEDKKFFVIKKLKELEYLAFP